MPGLAGGRARTCLVQAAYSTRFDELKATGQLPSPTGVALALLRLADDEKVSAREISRVLESDPAMAGRVLKLANSAMYGAARPVVAVREAVTRLGVSVVRNLALGFSLVSQSNRRACKEFPYQEFWSQSLLMAVTGQCLACHVPKVSADEAFTAGLLARVGTLALVSIYPEIYGEILAKGSHSPARLLEIERERFATDHNELSGAILRDWKLPDEVADAASRHEQIEPEAPPDESKTHDLARLLRLGRQLASVCYAPPSKRTSSLDELLTRAELLPVEHDAFVVGGDKAVGMWNDWGKILEIHTPNVPPFAELIRGLNGAGSERPHRGKSAVAFVDGNPVVAPFARRDGEIEPEGRDGGTTSEQLTILAVDDDRVVLRLLTKYLENAGHHVFQASNGHEALRLALDKRPQMVITDRVMPEMDGLAFCRALRQMQAGRQIYCIMLTSSDEEDDLIEAFEAGADDYVVKPFRPRNLQARLRAGQRVILLQEEVLRDKEELQRYAAEIAVVNRKLQQAAYTDALTGLPNRRSAVERLQAEWSASEGGHVLSCMMIDIDHFKKVNDTFGHDVGDLVLQETARVLAESTRKDSSTYRLGGEEFLVMCPGADCSAATVAGERLCQRVRQHVISAPGFQKSITLSIGVAAREASMRGWGDLLKAADQAVYLAKQAGRNRVQAFSPFRAF